MKKLLFISILLVFISCNNGLKEENETLKNQITKLESENKNLNEELTAFKMDPAVLLSKAETLFAAKNLIALNEIISSFDKYHPQSEMKGKVSIMISTLKADIEKEAAEKEKIKKQEEQKRLAAVSKLKKNHDDVSGVTWYENPYFTHYANSNLTSIYIGQKDSSVWLRLKMSYNGENWIFFKNAYLSYEGNTKEISFNEYDDKETEIGNGGVWEWIDITIDDSDIYFFKNLSESTDAKMRLSGKYDRTRNLSTNERKAIFDVLLAYDVLKKRI